MNWSSKHSPCTKDDSGRSNFKSVYKFKKLWALEHWSRWALDRICGLGY